MLAYLDLTFFSEDRMKRLALLTASLLTAIGCSVPTQPAEEDVATAARAKAALEAASQSGVSRRIALN